MAGLLTRAGCRALPMMSASRCSLFRVPLVPLSTTPIVWDKKLTYKLRLEDQALVKRLVMKIVGHVPKSVLTSLGVTLATRCSQDVDLLEFFKAFGMPDTFYSWMLVAELHLWMLSVRIMAEEMKEGEDVVHFMMEAFWKDAEERIKLVGGVSSTDRANYIRGLTEQLRLAFLIYDSGVIGDDKQLANALWRRFLDGSNPKPEQIELLVSYVRRTLSALDHIDINSLVMTGRFTWLTLKEEKFKV